MLNTKNSSRAHKTCRYNNIAKAIPTSKTRAKKHQIVTAQRRHIGLVNAQLHVVTLTPKTKLPQLVNLPLPSLQQQNDINHEQLDHPGNQFLHPDILNLPPNELVKFSQHNHGKTFMVQKCELESFLKKQTQRSQYALSNVQKQSLLGENSHAFAETTTSDDTSDDDQHHSGIQLYLQSQLSALQTAPKLPIRSVCDQENMRRKHFWDANHAKGLEIFQTPRKHEIQAILAASKGDLYTVKSILAYCYFNLLQTMHLLDSKIATLEKNQRVVQQSQNWGEVRQDDSTVKYSPKDYHFFAKPSDLDTFYDYLNTFNSPAMLQMLRQHPLFLFNSSAQLQKGGSVLHHAASSGDVDLLNFLFEYGGGRETINLRTANNSTPLHWCCGGNGSLDAVKLLIKHGADPLLTTESWSVDIFGRDSGQTPLHWAASSGNTVIVDYLYKLNPSTIGLLDQKGNSPLASAKKGLHFDTMRKVEKLLSDEFVAVTLDVHTVEQNMYFDPKTVRDRGFNGAPHRSNTPLLIHSNSL